MLGKGPGEKNARGEGLTPADGFAKDADTGFDSKPSTDAAARVSFSVGKSKEIEPWAIRLSEN